LLRVFRSVSGCFFFALSFEKLAVPQISSAVHDNLNE